MKVVIAPDSFKDAMRASEVTQRIEHGLRAVLEKVKTDLCPVSDGGEGFTDVFRLHPRVHYGTAETIDPLGRPIEAEWLAVPGLPSKPPMTCYEFAMASGLELLTLDERDPLRTTSFGTGMLIREARGVGGGEIILGIGGSATNDAGCGMAQALGVLFFDHDDEPITKPITGGDLKRITRIEVESTEAKAYGLFMKAACDVTNPLTGHKLNAHVYAPQKGATPDQVEGLDAGLRHIAQLWRDQLGVDVEQMPGAGAAGGVGGGLVAMLGAELAPGAELVLDMIGFDERIKDAALVITGEGRLDSQSLNGKAAMTVAKCCQEAGVPCVALVGSVGKGAEQALKHGLSAYYVIGEGLPAEESIRRTGELLEQAAMKLAQERLLD